MLKSVRFEVPPESVPCLALETQTKKRMILMMIQLSVGKIISFMRKCPCFVQKAKVKWSKYKITPEVSER